MRIVCVSDTHDAHEAIDVPDGDVLVHAGDATMLGTHAQIRAFDAWLGTLPHRHKVVIAGNHDWLFEREPAEARALVTNAIYLQDSGVALDGVRFWGSPWQPWFFDWAFNLERGSALRERWDLVPDDTDVLLTHGPPRGVLDTTTSGERAGCDDLLAALARIQPRLHVFGHIHEAYGREERDGTVLVNACSCDVRYRPVQPPVVVDLD